MKYKASDKLQLSCSVDSSNAKMKITIRTFWFLYNLETSGFFKLMFDFKNYII